VSTGTEPATSTVQKVFICYRREETAAHAGRLYDAMVARFGERNVFMDVDLAPGVDFVERITQVVSGCVVLIVVIGPNWATVEDEDGNVRIADPDDFVRLEVGTALHRPEVTPIPVLVAGARMPKRENLPVELEPLTRRNALELSDARWSYDVGRLNTRLDELLAEIAGVETGVAASEPEQPREPGPEPQGPSSGRLLLEGTLVGGAMAYAARWLAQPIPEGEGTAAEIAGVVLRRGVTWALVGAALAVWLAMRTRRTNVGRMGTAGLLIGGLAGAVGGMVFALPVILPSDHLSTAVKARIEIGSLAVTGGILGAMLGWLWEPPRLAAGLLSGIAGGALSQLLLNESGWDYSSTSATVLAFALRAAAISGLSLAALLALDRQAVHVTRQAGPGRTGTRSGSPRGEDPRRPGSAPS
jgi:hypothetical protein